MRTTKNMALSLIDQADKVSMDPINQNTKRMEEAILQRHTNLLDNWCFADPVDQRGGYVANGAVASKTDEGAVRGYVSFGYTIDRWQLTSSNGLLTIEDSGVALSGQKGAIWLAEYLDADFSKQLYGKPLTVSVIADGNLYSKTGTVTADPVTANTAQFSAHFENGYCGLFKSANGGIFVSLNAASGQTVRYTAVKLEVGANQTLAHQDAEGNWVLNDPPPNKNEELIKCCISTADPVDTYANNRKTSSAVGAAKVVTGSYVGTGVYGQSNPCVLTFDFEPKLVMVYSASLGAGFGTKFNSEYRGAILAAKGTVDAKRTDTVISNGGSVTKQEVTDRYTWGDNSFAWYSSTSVAGYSMTAAGQMNDSGVNYHYLAIG